MNELTEFGPENNALGRRWGAQTPLVFTMASDAFPIVHVGFRDMDEELVALRGDAMRASMFAGATAVAARFSAVGLANPIDSGVIGILERFEVSAGAAATIRVMRQGLAVSALQASALGFPTDSRQSERASIRLISTDEAAIANYGSVLYAMLVPNATDSLDRHFPYVLGPASTLWFVCSTVNTAINIAVQWRQRRITSWENRGVGT